jgi:methionyl-tRNA synthetase
MAKDILWFHAIIWPAMLLALGEKLPKTVFAHGFFTIDGQKMSKSLGNVLDPNYLVDKYGHDAIRYTLLREFPFGEDGDISEEKIASRYQADLGNELGNLLQRTLSMINKYEVKIKNEAKDLKVVDDALIENLQFDTYLINLWKAVKNCNALIDGEKPWELVKSDKARLAKVLTEVYTNLMSISRALKPFMPETSQKMVKQLDTKRPEPLFPRIEDAN